MRQLLSLVIVVAALASPAPAQPERYELGRRLRQFEAAWEQQPDPAARKRALAVLPKVTNQFLSLQFGEAGRTLDEARFALRAEPPTDAERWLTALYAVPEKRYFGKELGNLRVEVRAFYKVKGDAPAGAVARLAFGQEPPIEVDLDRLPATASLRIPPPADGADHTLTFETLVAGQSVPRHAIVLSQEWGHTIATNRAFEAMVQSVCGDPPTADTIEKATLLDRLDLRKRLTEGAVEETDYPAVALTGEGFRIWEQVKDQKPYFTADRPGRFWLSVATGKHRRTPCRLLVPKGLDRKKPVPLVVALHGAGGSENLFFEGYGAGHIVKECESRGWLLVAPRSGLISGPPVADIVAKLAERYPVDAKRVLVVGHSMGASQVVELVQQHPGKFAAIACLGGMGRVRKAEAFAELPVFVGVGTQDFLLDGAALHKALVAGGAKHATLKEYPDVEHLVIVREALPDVFAAWDKLAAK